jgi:hypothetical protein
MNDYTDYVINEQSEPLSLFKKIMESSPINIAFLKELWLYDYITIGDKVTLCNLRKHFGLDGGNNISVNMDGNNISKCFMNRFGDILPIEGNIAELNSCSLDNLLTTINDRWGLGIVDTNKLAELKYRLSQIRYL